MSNNFHYLVENQIVNLKLISLFLLFKKYINLSIIIGKELSLAGNFLIDFIIPLDWKLSR